MNGRSVAAYVACCVLWGSTWAAVKIGLESVPPLHFAAARLTLACVLITPFAVRAGLRAVGRRTWPTVALAGALNLGVPYVLLFAGQRRLPSAMAAVFFATFPVWILLVARVLSPGHRLTPVQIAAAVLGFGGVAIIQYPALRDATAGAPLAVGGSLVLGAAVLIAIASVIVKDRLREVAPAASAWGQITLSAAVLWPLALAIERSAEAHWSARAVGALVYLAAFGTVLPYLLLFWLMPRMPIAAVGFIPLLDTVVAMALGAILLDEPLTARFVAGAALVLSAAAVAQLRREPARRNPLVE